MQTTDAIADMLTRIRNASAAKHPIVEVPASNMKKAIASILLEEGFIRGFEVKPDGRQGMIRIALKYGRDRVPAITGIKRVSRPGLRRYSGCKEMPQVIRGMGVVIVSTSRGVISDKKAKELGVGGELVAYVW